MALGFPAKYTGEIPLGIMQAKEFLIIAIEAAEYLGWKIGSISKSGFTARTKASFISWSEIITVNIEEDKATLRSACLGIQLFDYGKNKKNIQNLIETVEELKQVFTPDKILMKYKALEAVFIPETKFTWQSLSLTGSNFNGFFSIFKPAKGYFITPLIIDLNILIYLLMIMSGGNFLFPVNQSLIKWGASFTPLTLNGQWWRLITNCFIHFGLIHLSMNMVALFCIGLLLEPYLGRIRFAIAYFLTGIAASTTSLWWHDFVISAGASGAIFGMYGIFLAMLTTNLIEKSVRKGLLVSIAIFVGYNLAYGMHGHIDNAAHIGGLICGFIIGYGYYPSLKRPDAFSFKYLTIGILTLIIISTSFIAYTKIPNDFGKYQKKIKSFAIIESMAMEVLRLPQNTPKEKILYGIKDRGIYYWNQDIKLINNLEKLNLPEIIHERDRKLIHYCNLRIKSYRLLYKTIEENTDKYRDSIKFYDKEIKEIINGLKHK